MVVRIRPKTVNEKLGDPTIQKVGEDSVAVGDRKFSFDSVLDSTSKQVGEIGAFYFDVIEFQFLHYYVCLHFFL